MQGLAQIRRLCSEITQTRIERSDRGQCCILGFCEFIYDLFSRASLVPRHSLQSPRRFWQRRLQGASLCSDTNRAHSISTGGPICDPMFVLNPSHWLSECHPRSSTASLTTPSTSPVASVASKGAEVGDVTGGEEGGGDGDGKVKGKVVVESKTDET